MISEDSSTTTTRRTLFDIGHDLETLADLLDEWDEGDEQQQQLINDWFEKLGEERDRKLDGYCAYIAQLQATALARRKEAERLSSLAQADETRIKLLKGRLKMFFQLHDLKSIQTARYKLNLAKNGGSLPVVITQQIDYSKIDARFQVTSIELDRKAIAEALQAGEQLEWARLAERGTSIRIK